MRIYFCRSNDIGGAVIRLATWSEWNHVAIEVGDYVYESLSSTGVRKIHKDQYKPWDGFKIVTVGGNEKRAKQFLEQQVGKKYDWLAIVAWFFRPDWQHDNRWFCSELVAMALVLAKAGVTFDAHMKRVSPQDVYEAVA